VWDLTRAEIEGRAQGLQALRALNRFAPGFETATLRTYGMTVGIRDTRKILGVYDLTEHDVRNQARFEDSIGVFPEFIDGYGVLILPTTAAVNASWPWSGVGVAPRASSSSTMRVSPAS